MSVEYRREHYGDFIRDEYGFTVEEWADLPYDELMRYLFPDTDVPEPYPETRPDSKYPLVFVGFTPPPDYSRNGDQWENLAL
jgi:hypothetical protein